MNSLNTNSVKQSLSTLIESADSLARATLKANGLTSEECQLIQIINDLNAVQHSINSISDHDLKVSTKELLTDSEIEDGWPDQHMLIDTDLLDNATLDIVNNASRISESFSELVNGCLNE